MLDREGERDNRITLHNHLARTTCTLLDNRGRLRRVVAYQYNVRLREHALVAMQPKAQMRRLVVGGVLPGNSHAIGMVVHQRGEAVVGLISCRVDVQRGIVVSAP